MAQQLEARMANQVFDIALGAGEEVVEANDIVAACDQTIAQVRTQKACAPRNQN